MATNKESRKEYWKRKWLSKYRLVVMDDSTYEEKTSFRLSRLNIFVFGSLFAFVLITLTTVLIIYSPLRQYILGYTAVENKRETLNLLFRVDSLEGKIQSNDEYLASLKKVLVGNIKTKILPALTSPTLNTTLRLIGQLLPKKILFFVKK